MNFHAAPAKEPAFRQNGHTTGYVPPVKKKLVLLDFDGTITTRDTLPEFLRYYKGNAYFITKTLKCLPALIRYGLRAIPNDAAKQQIFQHFFAGEPAAFFDERCRQFSREILPSLIRSKALEAIRRYRKENATLAVVSASPENWVRPWCDAHALICISTQLEVIDEKLTGRFRSRNCYGHEKVNRVQKAFTLSDYDEIIAYGDSTSDEPLLALSHQRFFKPFRS